MIVKDVFQTKVDYVTQDSTILDAARFIFGHNHKGLPVVKGKSKKLIGFITEQDILSQLFPNIRDLMDDYIHEKDFEEMEKKTKEIMTKKVKTAMNKVIISIHINEPLLEAESIMKLKDISRLPVVDNKGNLIGIISKGDIFRAIVRPEIRGFK
jgi:CBS domain-containing protein